MKKFYRIVIIILVISIITIACGSSETASDKDTKKIPTTTPDFETYPEMDVRELESYADNYIGNNVKITGEVFNIGEGFLQIHVLRPGGNKYDTTAIYVTYESEILPKGVYEDTNITVYGIVKGMVKGKNFFGGSITQPEIDAEAIKLSETSNIMKTEEIDETEDVKEIKEETQEQTPTQKPTINTNDALAKNYLVEVEENGVVIEIVRILICDSNWEPTQNEFSEYKSMDNKEAFIEIIFRVTNNREQKINTLITETIASFDGEQIKFDDYYFDTWIGDEFIDDILPGSIVIGGIWLGVSRSKFNEIEKIVISMPYISGLNYEQLTKDFIWTIDVNGWEFETYPTDISIGNNETLTY